MQTLPKELQIEIALNLSGPDLINFCLLDKSENAIICNNKTFWFRKLQRDYPQVVSKFQQSGLKFVNPKNTYMKEFTFISTEIEKFLNRLVISGEDKKSLYKEIYQAYHDAIVMDVRSNEELVRTNAFEKSARAALEGIPYDVVDLEKLWRVLYSKGKERSM